MTYGRILGLLISKDGFQPNLRVRSLKCNHSKLEITALSTFDQHNVVYIKVESLTFAHDQDTRPSVQSSLSPRAQYPCTQIPSKIGQAEYGVVRATSELLVWEAASQCCLDKCGELVVSVGFNERRVDDESNQYTMSNSNRLFEAHDCRASWVTGHVARLTMYLCEGRMWR